MIPLLLSTTLLLLRRDSTRTNIWIAKNCERANPNSPNCSFMHMKGVRNRGHDNAPKFSFNCGIFELPKKCWYNLPCLFWGKVLPQLPLDMGSCWGFRGEWVHRGLSEIKTQQSAFFQSCKQKLIFQTRLYFNMYIDMNESLQGIQMPWRFGEMPGFVVEKIIWACILEQMSGLRTAALDSHLSTVRVRTVYCPLRTTALLDSLRSTVCVRTVYCRLRTAALDSPQRTTVHVRTVPAQQQHLKTSIKTSTWWKNTFTQQSIIQTDTIHNYSPTMRGKWDWWEEDEGPDTKELNMKRGAGHDTSSVLKWTVFLVWNFLQKTHVQSYSKRYHGGMRYHL